ncbi:hypothetical protein [Cupriavidus oxalaticus]|uniref:hypothetical protein n=1 Tax=Cupriavidus oxalaticus TaxID=96344 RepID=UPI003F735CF1
MFLTKDEWRHPNRFVQAIASPSVAWCCISLGIIRSILLVEIKHKEAENEAHSEWIMLPQIEALADYLANSASQLGEIHMLIPAASGNLESWSLERVVALRKWAAESHIGLECKTEAGEWHSSVVRPREADIICSWSLAGSSSWDSKMEGSGDLD